MSNQNQQAGYSYIDVMIAVTILLVGIMAMLAAITRGVQMTTRGQDQLAAKQYALSTVEAIFSARDLDSLGFESIGNVGDSTIPSGVFLTGDRQFYTTAGPDGIVGTADDSAGPDGVVGNTDDTPPVDGYLRNIVITNIPDPDRPTPPAPITLRQIDVTIIYMIGNTQQRETVTTYAANYRTNTNDTGGS